MITRLYLQRPNYTFISLNHHCHFSEILMSFNMFYPAHQIHNKENNEALMYLKSTTNYLVN